MILSGMAWAFILYSATLIAISYAFYKTSSQDGDYILGHRSVNYVVTAIATQASDMGAWLFLGLPAAVFISGIPEAWSAIGLITGMLATWLLIAKRLRVQSEQLGAETVNEYFVRRFRGSARTALLMTSAAVTLYFSLFYISAGLVGLGRLFEASFGTSFEFGAGISMLIALAYTLIGGYLSVAWCDLFQGLLLLVMIVMVPLFGLWSLGGISALTSALHTTGLPLSLIGQEGLWKPMTLALGWGLGYFGQPHILLNFLGIKDPNNINRAAAIGISWQIIVLSASICIGLVGVALYQDPTFDPQHAFIQMALDTLSPFIAGVAICGVIAATLSSLDSLILLAGTTTAHDLYSTFIQPQASQRIITLLARIGSIAIACGATLLAMTQKTPVYSLVNYAWSGFGAAFGPAMILSLYWPRAQGTAIVAGMIGGALCVALWPLTGSEMLPLVPAFLLSTAIIGIGTIFNHA